MPIFEQTYRTYDGHERLTLRWVVIIWQEFRVLSTARPFLVLLFWAALLLLMRVLQVVAWDSMRATNRDIAMMMNQVEAMAVNAKMFFDFLRMEGPVMFIMMLYVGSGMICDDFRNNLMEVFFSKPMNWIDYFLGKALTLVIIGLGVTLVPGLFLLLLHNLLVPGMKTFRETAWLVGPITGFSCLLVFPAALGVLASSALSKGQRHSMTAILMVLMGNMAIAQVLSSTLHKVNYLAISIPLSINRVGEALFAVRRTVFDLHWGWALAIVLVVTGICALTVSLRIRRAEFAA